MSTVGFSASGQRSLHVTVNDEARTGASSPTKQGDAVIFTVGGHNGELRLTVPAGARIERLMNPKSPEEAYYRLIIPGGVSNARYVRAEGLDAEASDPWPHASLDVRRNPDPGYTDDWPVEHVGTVGQAAAAAEAADAAGTDAGVPSTGQELRES